MFFGPAAVDPEPLTRVFADTVFYKACDSANSGFDVRVSLTNLWPVERRVEGHMKAVLIPDHAHGQNGALCLE